MFTSVIIFLIKKIKANHFPTKWAGQWLRSVTFMEDRWEGLDILAQSAQGNTPAKELPQHSFPNILLLKIPNKHQLHLKLIKNTLLSLSLDYSLKW